MSRKINPALIKKLEESKVNTSLALYYLFSLYHNISISVSRSVIRRVNMLGIVDYDMTEKKIIWKLPFYSPIVESTKETRDWVKEYQNLFRDINAERRGSRQTCINRFSKIMSEHPELTPDVILKVTEFYIARLHDPMYIKKSHKFIYEGSWSEKNSMLYQYYEDWKESEDILNDPENELM